MDIFNDREEFVRSGNRRDWRETCRDVLSTRDPMHVNSLLEELLEALEERAQERKHPPSDPQKS